MSLIQFPIKQNSKSMNQVEQKEENTNFQLALDLDTFTQDHEQVLESVNVEDSFPTKENVDQEQQRLNSDSSPKNLNQKEQATIDQEVSKDDQQIDNEEYLLQDQNNNYHKISYKIEQQLSQDFIQDETINKCKQTIIDVQSVIKIQDFQQIDEWFIRTKINNRENYQTQTFSSILKKHSYVQLIISRFPNELNEILIIKIQNHDSHQDEINHNIYKDLGIRSESDEEKDFKGLYQENLVQDQHNISYIS